MVFKANTTMQFCVGGGETKVAEEEVARYLLTLNRSKANKEMGYEQRKQQEYAQEEENKEENEEEGKQQQHDLQQLLHLPHQYQPAIQPLMRPLCSTVQSFRAESENKDQPKKSISGTTDNQKRKRPSVRDLKFLSRTRKCFIFELFDVLHSGAWYSDPDALSGLCVPDCSLSWKSCGEIPRGFFMDDSHDIICHKRVEGLAKIFCILNQLFDHMPDAHFYYYGIVRNIFTSQTAMQSLCFSPRLSCKIKYSGSTITVSYF